ncbi:hypothetical protein [Stenotrophomonas sp. 24(2023)]|uniref:hypothetical protein n=1 Tax=Stenotrophomonas sp. 24(2023) TaxID=3068324 RepID=UPI0027E0E56B|nr:hypothetical protein [Stenotrophomonas sp. 24(2023)]WMJ70056.1 hypothetical protein Q9R17_02820 [Stenotrophomonas sp. 24(2023)]
MNTHDPDSSFDPDLQARLRALPDERAVPEGSWERLALRLPPREAPAAPGAAPATVVALPRRRRWLWPVGAAMAASLALYWVTPGQRHDTVPGAAPSLMQAQADDMTRQYQQAVAESLPANADAGEWQPALAELDHSARQIRAALAQDPRSRLLLEQLQRTYALRLQLTRQAAQSAAGMAT